MFEKFLYQHLQSCNVLAPFLAVHNGAMAIFNQEAPDDMDSGWESKSQYGRIIYFVTMQDDPERNISGTLNVDLVCESEGTPPEEIEPVLKSVIDGYFFGGEAQTIAADWLSSNYFTDPTRKEVGVTLTFSLSAFPAQETIDPDPVTLVNRWTKAAFPDAHVIGMDVSAGAWKPTGASPAIYWRLVDIGPCSYINDTYAAYWQTAQIKAHVFTPDYPATVSVLREMDNALTDAKRLLFDDNAPLMIDSIKVSPGSNDLKMGQLELFATYGILRHRKPAEKIRSVSMRNKGGI